MKKKKVLFYSGCLAIITGILCTLHIGFIEMAAFSVQKKLMANKMVTDLKEEHQNITESNFSIIYYHQTEEQYVPLIAGMIDTYYKTLSSDLQLGDTEKIAILLHSTKKEMAEAVKANENNVPMGAYYGGVIHILSPGEWIAKEEDIVDRFMEDGPVLHEMAHYMLDRKLMGQYDVWFTEGVALYFEKKYLNYSWREDLKGKCNYITYYDLKNKFYELDEIRAYRRSYEIIDKIIKDVGEDGFREILFEMKKGKKIEKLYPIV